MSAPVPFTCPDIDSVISEIDGAVSTLSDLTSRKGLLEKLREANDELRRWGEDQEERAEGLESELAEANNRIENLEEELCDLKGQLMEQAA